MASKQNRLGELLVQRGVITKVQLQQALLEQRRTGRRLGQTLVSMGFASEKHILRALTQNVNVTEPQTKTEEAKVSAGSVARVAFLAALFVAIVVVLFWVFLKIQNYRVEQPQVATSGNVDTEMSVSEAELIETVAVSKIETESVTKAEVGQHPIEVGPIEASVEAAIVPDDKLLSIEGPMINVIDTSATAEKQTIKLLAVRIGSGVDDMRVIFETTQPIEPQVQRDYVSDKDVIYTFTAVDRAALEFPQMKDRSWLSDTFLVDTDTGFQWFFTMTHAGSAKYHQLEPSASNDNYRFVVIVRK